MREGPRTVVTLGMPSAAGASAPGVDGGPRALREAGLVSALEAVGARVVERAELARIPFEEDLQHPRARNVAAVARAVAMTAEAVAGVSPGELALVLGGGCSLLAGVVLGLGRRDGQPPGIALLDAHADFNTPATTPSGFLDGMALALALGQGPAEIAGGEALWARADEAAVIGFRELDPPERERLGMLALAISGRAARTMGVAEVRRRVLSATGIGRLVIHVDVDVLDPLEMPAKDGSPPGPGLEAAELGVLLSGMLGSPRTAALLVSGFNPLRDPGGRWAGVLVRLLARALA